MTEAAVELVQLMKRFGNVVAQDEDENIDYIILKEGAVMWVDNLCVTKDAGSDSDRMDMVYQWFDFLNRPDIAATNTNWYGMPHLTRLLSQEYWKKFSHTQPSIPMKPHLSNCNTWERLAMPPRSTPVCGQKSRQNNKINYRVA